MMKTILLASTATMILAAFMSETCEVVMIQTDNGPVRINKDDYDPEKHTLSDETETVEQTVQQPPAIPVDNAPAAPSAPDLSGNAVAPSTVAPNTRLVSKTGTGKNAKFIITDATGAPITGVEGVDEAGYATEKDAWAAVMALPH